jgi:hypothetical protein
MKLGMTDDLHPLCQACLGAETKNHSALEVIISDFPSAASVSGNTLSVSGTVRRETSISGSIVEGKGKAVPVL